MDFAQISNSEFQEEQKLPRRDWFLLPALSLLTLLCLLAISELIAYVIYKDTGEHNLNCIVVKSSSTTYGAIPNCVASLKTLEGSPAEYRFNSSGYRSDKDFGPKSPGTFRIVVIGASFAMGYQVPIEDAFATRLAPDLSQLTAKNIETLNMGLMGHAGYPYLVNLRFKVALDTKPDLILRILTPWDIQHQSDSYATEKLNINPPAQQSRLEASFTRLEKHTPRLVLLLRHFLYQSQSQYVKSYLINGDRISDAAYLKNDLNAECNKELSIFNSDDARIQAQVKDAGVTLVTAYIPIRAQAAMISIGEWPDGYNPYKLDNELRSIVTSHGGTYIDILPEFRNIPNPEKYFMAVDGHPTVEGNRIISKMLANELTKGAVPALNATAYQIRPQEQKK